MCHNFGSIADAGAVKVSFFSVQHTEQLLIKLCSLEFFSVFACCCFCWLSLSFLCGYFNTNKNNKNGQVQIEAGIITINVHIKCEVHKKDTWIMQESLMLNENTLLVISFILV